MCEQAVLMLTKSWVRNLIAFSTSVVISFLLGGIPVIIYSKRIDAVIPMILFGIFLAPLVSGIVCGLLVHEKGSLITIIAYAILILAVGYITLYATDSAVWLSPSFPAVGGGVAFLGSIIGSQFIKSRREKKEFMRRLEWKREEE